MRLSPRQRWAAYAVAGALTAAAMLAVDRRPEAAAVVQAVARPAAAAGGGRQSPPSPLPLPLPAPLTLDRRVPAAPQSDPFAPLGAETMAAAAAAAAARPAAGPPPAPLAPPLPFSYLGRWQEQGRSAVFLWRGDRSFKVLGAGPLDADYAVERLGPRHVVLRYLPLNELQQLSFDAPPPAPAPQASAPGAAPPADGTPVEDN